MRGRTRGIVDLLVSALCRLMLRTFFRDVDVLGLDRVPRGVPLVIVANHVNSLVDPMLLLGFLGVHPRVLAKSTLWGHPVVGPLLILAGALPVYRRGEADPSRNAGTFSRCVELLAGGEGAIALFPEGKSHDEAALQPLKTGAARIVLLAEAARPGLQVAVLPVGLVYEAKDRFRSRVVVHVGDVITSTTAPNGERALQPPAAVRELTARIAEGLGAVVTAHAHDDERLESEPGAARGAWNGVMARAARLVRLPAALLGVVLNWVPYKIPGWVARRFGSTQDSRASYKLLAALFAFPLFWLAAGLVVGVLDGVVSGVAAASLAPVAGWMTLRLLDPKRRG